MTFENLPWVAPTPRQTIDRCIKVSCDAYRKLVTVNLRSTNWSSNLTLNNVWFQILSIRRPRKGFFLRLPHLSGNFSQASYIYLNVWAFENASPPPPPQNFQSLLWGEYGYFLELHNAISTSSYKQTILFQSV